ncbi:hypothetical protein [Burkholderia pyrrocinia]|uniref:hypothetical protein n=1 Tax=Burkholderia pyrrocinia TaxID=60550 RepID=UPI002AB09F7E|nr:hypothetical protein [Burkholderia pyrrocinia]
MSASSHRRRETRKPVRHALRRHGRESRTLACPPSQRARGLHGHRTHDGTPLAEITGKPGALASTTTIRSPSMAADETGRAGAGADVPLPVNWMETNP